MNWDAIGAVGEILGAIAVFCSLIYLAIQIRQQRVSQNAQSVENILEGFNRANEHLATSPDLATLFVRGLHKPDQLNPTEAAQFSSLFRLFVNQYSKIYGVYQRGLLSETDWQGHAKQGALLMNTPGGKLWIEKNQGNFEDFYAEFLRYEHDETAIDLTMGREWEEYSR